MDPEACQQIRSKTYVDNGAGVGNRQQVERFRGKRVDGCYNGTIPRILSLVGLNLKVMVASGDHDEDVLELMGQKHCWVIAGDLSMTSSFFALQLTCLHRRKGNRSWKKTSLWLTF